MSTATDDYECMAIEFCFFMVCFFPITMKQDTQFLLETKGMDFVLCGCACSVVLFLGLNYMAYIGKEGYERLYVDHDMILLL